MRALSAEGVVAGYGRVPIVHGVSVAVDGGSMVAIVGPNGAGKSTLAKAIAGVIPSTSGQIRVGDEDISGLPAHQIVRRGLAYVPQNQNVFPSLTVVENLEMGAYTRKEGVATRIRNVLDIFPDLQAATKKRAGVLSGGQQNMLGLARALMLDPKIVLLDEPTAGLSPHYTQIVWDQIGRIRELGIAALVVEQNVDRALRNADFVYVMVAGENRVEGPAKDVAMQDLASIFLGQPAASVAGRG
ncbi:MAG: ABC transporter ATP-binding protein [Chloroflexota bacterium]|nr:ABC transporter ATP-binding protein [Chloroflexota bacterium]